MRSRHARRWWIGLAAGGYGFAALAQAPAPNPPMASPPLPISVAAAVPAPTPRGMSREAHSLFYRLDLRLQQFSRDYHRPPATRPSLQQLDGQLDEIEILLAQLRRHPLPKDRQIVLFKTEMNLRGLRDTTVPNR